MKVDLKLIFAVIVLFIILFKLIGLKSAIVGSLAAGGTAYYYQGKEEKMQSGGGLLGDIFGKVSSSVDLGAIDTSKIEKKLDDAINNSYDTAEKYIKTVFILRSKAKEIYDKMGKSLQEKILMVLKKNGERNKDLIKLLEGN